MVPGQEANSNNLEIFFFHYLHNNCMLRVLVRIALMRQFYHLEMILMSSHNIQFHDKIRKFP